MSLYDFDFHAKNRRIYMSSNVWTKTTLSAYPYLVKLADAIDRMVEKRALNSFYVSSSNYANNNIYDIANQIIDLAERKKILINLKVLVENCLKKCEKHHAKLLILRYISQKKGREVANAMGIIQRKYYRWAKEAEDSFSKHLLFEGFNDKKLEEYLHDESWILEIKDSYEKSKSDDFCVKKINTRIAV